MSKVQAVGVTAVHGAASPSQAEERELISALADGQLEGESWARAVALAASDHGQQTWDMYHLIGDTMRSSELARTNDLAAVRRVREALAAEAPLPRWTEDRVVAPVPVAAGVDAANAALWRWKMVAGVASIAAVAAVGWTSMSLAPTSGGAQLAVAPPAAAVQAPVIAVAEGVPAPVMIRDPRLDELLAAHRQFSGTNTLQMPAGFLRNANFGATAVQP